MDRREFIKAAGLSAAAVGAAACAPKTFEAKAETTKREISGTMAQNFEGVSLLGYGCMRWPTKRGDDGRNHVDQDEVNRLVDYAIEHGINYFDTAPVYLEGESEIATSIALNRHPRSSWKLATKMSNFGDFSYDNSVRMYRESLKFFKTDYIDYYLMHSIGDAKAFETRFDHLIGFLQEERKAGRIRNLGFSFHGSAQGIDELLALHEKYHWDFVQIQMNYLDWTHASGRNSNADYLYEALTRLGIPVVIMEPLRGGQLANLPASLAEKLKEREPSRSIASWAFRFAGSFPNVLTVLSGMTYMEHLQDNLSSYCGFQPLSDDDKALLEQVASQLNSYPLVRCTGCQYCMPCPYGINIPAIFSFYNSNVNAGSYVSSKEQEGYDKIRRRYLGDYDKAIPADRQADHCIACGKCVSKCPQRIAIPRELRRIDEYVDKLKKDEI